MLHKSIPHPMWFAKPLWYGGRAMAKSETALKMDEVQREIKAFLKPKGFRVRGRTFNRGLENGLIQVINLQMGRFDPPGTYYIPWFREKLYGRFTVNLGVYVPEVGRCEWGTPKSIIHDASCRIRSRLGSVDTTETGEEQDLWWKVDPRAVMDVIDRLSRHAFPYFEQHGTREAILDMCANTDGLLEHTATQYRIVAAIICAEKGDIEEARRYLSLLLKESANNEYVHSLAEKLGLAPLVQK